MTSSEQVGYLLGEMGKALIIGVTSVFLFMCVVGGAMGIIDLLREMFRGDKP